MTYGDIRPSVEGSTEGTPPRGVAPRGVPEVDPDTRGCITHTLEHVRKYCHYFTGGAKRRSATYRQPSLGMVVTYTHKTPRDDCPIRKVMPILSSVLLLIGFS